MSAQTTSPSAPPAAGAKKRKTPHKTRRQVLKILALGVPAAAGAAAGLARAASAADAPESAFSGDPARWRQRFLAEARSTEAIAVGEADVAVRTRAQGAEPAGALPRAAAAPAEAPAE